MSDKDLVRTVFTCTSCNYVSEIFRTNQQLLSYKEAKHYPECMLIDKLNPINYTLKHHYSEPTKEKINHPAHYNMGKIEVIEVIEDWKLDFHLGNAVKYIGRAPHKGNEIQDLQKARWYLDRRIDQLIKEAGEIKEDDK